MEGIKFICKDCKSEQNEDIDKCWNCGCKRIEVIDDIEFNIPIYQLER